ncbi:MAG: putative toxin-antitoxin system toxin component, PIN family [Chloroflexi bacterium]|nr:putative toxin-antitoxin system toxin component, PIN family [Chloroflexota bacterium]
MSERSAEPSGLPRVVVDTNLLLLGMFSLGLYLPIIRAWINDEFELVISNLLLDELAEVSARPKFRKRITKTDAEKLLELIWRKANVIAVGENPVLGRDPDDYPVLGAAIAANATHIVTNDKDLLEDATVKSEKKRLGVEIVSAGELLRFLKARRHPS